MFVYDSGEEGKCGQGKENQGQQARTVAETGRRDGKEGNGDWKRERRGLEKREKKPDNVQLTV